MDILTIESIDLTTEEGHDRMLSLVDAWQANPLSKAAEPFLKVFTGFDFSEYRKYVDDVYEKANALSAAESQPIPEEAPEEETFIDRLVKKYINEKFPEVEGDMRNNVHSALTNFAEWVMKQ